MNDNIQFKMKALMFCVKNILFGSNQTFNMFNKCYSFFRGGVDLDKIVMCSLRIFSIGSHTIIIQSISLVWISE